MVLVVEDAIFKISVLVYNKNHKSRKIHPHLLGLMYYVYVLKSEKDGRLYIGYTSNLTERIKQHNDGKNFSTVRRTPFSLTYYEAFSSEKDATTREKQLKQFKSSYGQLKKRIANSLNG